MRAEDDGCTVVKARRIHDLGDSGGRQCRSIAIRGGRIVASAAKPDELDGLAGSPESILDAGDLTFIPGFFDAHSHFLWGGMDVNESVVIDATTLDEFVAGIAAAASQREPGEWILTSRDWNEQRLAEGRLPTAEELDRASTLHPICVRRRGSAVVGNSLAMRIAGITSDIADPAGGEIGRNGDGVPNGQFVGPAAIRLLADHVPEATVGQRAAGARCAAELFAGVGVTTVRDVGVYREDMLAFHLARQRGWLPIRARVALRLDPKMSTEEQLREIEAWPVSSRFGDEHLQIDAVCLVADGGFDSAATSFPYAKDPNFHGKLWASTEGVTQVVEKAVDRGWRIVCSSFGDRAVEQMLSVYEAAQAAHPELPPGWFGFDHALLATASQRARAGSMGVAVTLSYEAVYALADSMREAWGPEVAETALPIKEWAKVNPLLCAGSAYNGGQPVNPLRYVWGMTTRLTNDGRTLGPQNAVTRQQALEICTIGGRRAFDGNAESALADGQLADLVGYRADPLECAIDDLPELVPAMTLVGGTVVHQTS